MKHKLRQYLLLIITALVFTFENPVWHWQNALKGHLATGDEINLLMVWGETCLAIGAFAIVIALLAPPFSRFFLGYESKKPDEGDEVFFYVLLTLFIFSLCFVAEQLLVPPQRDSAKDLKFICDILNDNDIDVGSDAILQKVETICGNEPEKPESDKE